jgi:hypothetical protein
MKVPSASAIEVIASSDPVIGVGVAGEEALSDMAGFRLP